MLKRLRRMATVAVAAAVVSTVASRTTLLAATPAIVSGAANADGPGWEVVCHVGTIADLAAGKVGVEIVGFPEIILVCEAVWITDVIWDDLVDPLANDIYNFFNGMAGGAYHKINDADVDAVCDDCVYTSPDNATYTAEVDGELSSQYCGYADCWCDTNDDCYSQYCDPDGYCEDTPPPA